MHTNEGHRQRVKDRFRGEGLDNFDEVHVLELLLFYVVARKDTKPVARALLDHFGSLAQVLEATYEELEKVEGVGPSVSTFLKLIPEAGRYYLVQRGKERYMNDPQSFGEYLIEHFCGRRNETVYLLCLDSKYKMICCRKLGEGSVNSAGISVRQIVEIALSVNASAVVLAHNHPSGIAVPSGEDVAATRRLARALYAVDVILADHIVVADRDYISMVQSGLYHPNDSE